MYVCITLGLCSVCMYVCIYVLYVRIYVFVCMYACMYVALGNNCINVCICIRMFACMACMTIFMCMYVCMYVCSMKKYLNESVYARICDSIAPLQPNLQQLSGHVRHAHDGHVSYPTLAQVDLLQRTVCMYVLYV